MFARTSLFQVFEAAIALLAIVMAPRASGFMDISQARYLDRARVPIQQRLQGINDAADTGDSWKETHLIHGASEIQEETEKEMLKSEDWAAFDAHDLDDPGMEAAVMERAVMMAAEMAHEKKKSANEVEDTQTTISKREEWAQQHLIHGAAEIHEETEKEMLKSENWAAFDAHDCDDPGMEAAVMERAVMMAADMARARKQKAKRQKP